MRENSHLPNRGDERLCGATRNRWPLSRGRCAFTLIELLVVISIIALLISMLLPALAAARSTARMSACLTNLRQLCMTFHVYSMDNLGHLPRRTWSDIPGNSGYIWPAEFWARGYVSDLRSYSCAEMQSMGGQADFAKENTWLGGRQPTATVMTQFFWQSSHFGYNVRNLGSNFRNNSASGWTGPTARMEEIARPSGTVLLADSIRPAEYYQLNQLFGRYDLIDRFSTTDTNGGLHVRHAGGVNIGWVDGHATHQKANPANPYETLGEYNVSALNIWSR